MKILTTRNGTELKICDCHYELVKSHTWTPQSCQRYDDTRRRFKTSMSRDGSMKDTLIHRLIMGFPKGMVVDHIDGDPSNNQCSNLRVITQAQNSLNNHGAKRGSISGRKGVYWHKAAQKWCAEVVFEKKKHYLGLFDTPEAAAESYNIKAKELHGEFFQPS